MFRDKPQVDAAFYERLKRHDSEPEIMEIGSWASLVWGMAGWISTMHLYPGHDRDGDGVDQAASARVYGVVPAVRALAAAVALELLRLQVAIFQRRVRPASAPDGPAALLAWQEWARRGRGTAPDRRG